MRLRATRFAGSIPDMKEGDVHATARAKNPEAWQEHKLGKLGQKRPTLPQWRHQREQAGDEHPAADTSMRTPA